MRYVECRFTAVGTRLKCHFVYAYFRTPGNPRGPTDERGSTGDTHYFVCFFAPSKQHGDPIPRTHHETLKEASWKVHGPTMDPPWNNHGPSMEQPGPTTEASRTNHEPTMDPRGKHHIGINGPRQTLNGTTMDQPWTHCYGSTTVSPWKQTEESCRHHGLTTEASWRHGGPTLGPSRTHHGPTCMDYPWTHHGPTTAEAPQTHHGSTMDPPRIHLEITVSPP